MLPKSYWGAAQSSRLCFPPPPPPPPPWSDPVRLFRGIYAFPRSRSLLSTYFPVTSRFHSRGVRSRQLLFVESPAPRPHVHLFLRFSTHQHCVVFGFAVSVVAEAIGTTQSHHHLLPFHKLRSHTLNPPLTLSKRKASAQPDATPSATRRNKHDGAAATPSRRGASQGHNMYVTSSSTTRRSWTRRLTDVCLAATISPAQFDQPSETATLETPPVPITTNTAHDTQTTEPSVWQRLTTGIKRFVARFCLKKAEGDLWRREVCVLLDHGDDELRRTVIALFDPQCEENLISTTCLRNAFPTFEYESSAGVSIGTSITGLEAYMSIAMISIRWSEYHARRKRRPNDILYFLPLFYSSNCRVIESNKFDLIIGRRTIDDLELFKRNKDAIAAVRPVNTNISGMSQAFSVCSALIIDMQLRTLTTINNPPTIDAKKQKNTRNSARKRRKTRNNPENSAIAPMGFSCW